MDFKILKGAEFTTLSSAKKHLVELVKNNQIAGLEMIAFIKKVSNKYVIYFEFINNSLFIDDIIDYVKQWQVENNEYIECVMMPHYESVITVEFSY